MFNLENVINVVIKNGRLKDEAIYENEVVLAIHSLGKLQVHVMYDGSRQLWHKGADPRDRRKGRLLGILEK